MSARNKMPQRRAADLLAVTHLWAPGTDKQIAEPMTLSIGYYPAGEIGEVFINYAPKTVSERAHLLGNDIATLISIALQYGVPLEVMRAAAGRSPVNFMGRMIDMPHSPIGTVLDALGNVQAGGDA